MVQPSKQSFQYQKQHFHILC